MIHTLHVVVRFVRPSATNASIAREKFEYDDSICKNIVKPFLKSLEIP